MLRTLFALAILTVTSSAFAQVNSVNPRQLFSTTGTQPSVAAPEAQARIKNSVLSGECRYKPQGAPCGCGSDNLCVGTCDGVACKILK